MQCYALEELDISSFKLEQLQNATSMLSDLNELKMIKTPALIPENIEIKLKGNFGCVDNDGYIKEYSKLNSDTVKQIKLGRMYGIQYELNNGINTENAPNKYYYGYGTLLPIPMREEMIFDGWYEKEDFTGDKVERINDSEFGNKKYYLKWKLNVKVSNDEEYYDGDKIDKMKVYINQMEDYIYEYQWYMLMETGEDRLLDNGTQISHMPTITSVGEYVRYYHWR